MNTDFEKAFEISNLMAVVANQKKSLKEEFENSTLYFYNGGTFKIDQTIIAFVLSLKMMDQTTAVIIDQNKLPIFIENINTFLSNILDCYTRASNKFLTEYKKIQDSREIESILNV
jgi:GMP synthase PP-ATPase subunit